MGRRERITTVRPLAQLWSARGHGDAKRVRPLDAPDIEAMFADSPPQLVVADGSLTLEWVPADRAADFWQSEVKPRLVDPRASRVPIDSLPGRYGYTATHWISATGAPVILLERLH